MLSKKAKYAINALVYISKHKDDSPILAKDISESENIPYKFLEAILTDLKKAGILESKKGRSGGYFLSKRPDEINLAEIMRLIDGPIAMLSCVCYNQYKPCEECKDESKCGIRKVFLDLRNITVSYLKGTTIEDIIQREN